MRAELNCSCRISFVEDNASAYAIEGGAFDIVSCIGATRIGGGLTGTVKKLKPALRTRDNLLLVGEPLLRGVRHLRRQSRHLRIT
jgi:hypothetical protein